MESKVSCVNNKCEYNFNDCCTTIDRASKVNMSENEVCGYFEYGINEGYKENPWYEKELAELNEIKKQVAEITHDL